ncbi:hypothetical protein ACWIWK_03300 [Helicobacter sp. 23-1048]
MRIIWLIGIFCIGAFGVDVKKADIIVNANDGEHEVILEFDSDYTLTPKTKETSGFRAIVFEGVSANYKTRRNERIQDSFLTEIQIFNLSDEGLHILGIGDSKDFTINLTRAQNTFKITFAKATPPLSPLDTLLETPRPMQKINPAQAQQDSPQVESTPSTSSPLLSDVKREPMSIDLWRYFALVGVMLLLIAVLIWLRSSMKGGVKSNGNFTNIFGGTASKGNVSIDGFDSSFKIIAQKKLDAKNKILTIETNGYRYLVLMGQNNNTIIDRFKIATNTPNGANGVNINNLIIEDTQFAKLLEKKEQRIKQLKSQSV